MPRGMFAFVTPTQSNGHLLTDTHQDCAIRRRSHRQYATQLIALCFALSGCASQQAATGLPVPKITDDPGCRELLAQVERWEVQRAEMFLGGTDAPYTVKCVASGGDTVIALVPPQGNRIALLPVARRSTGLRLVERVFGIRIRAGEWQLSRDIDGEAHELNSGMGSRTDYQAILEDIWKALPRNIRKPLTIP